MAFHDIENAISVLQTLLPAARTATVNGTTVDIQGFQSAAIIITFGTWTDGTHTPSIQHSTDGTTFTNCDSNSLNTTLSAVSSAAGNGTVQKIGYTGSNRYLRVVMTVTGATIGATSAAMIVRSHAANNPL